MDFVCHNVPLLVSSLVCQPHFKGEGDEPTGSITRKYGIDEAQPSAGARIKGLKILVLKIFA